jgi:circadian clock protein KaiC
LIDDNSLDAVSSLADNWLFVQNEMIGGKRKRSLLVVKARGMEHSNDLIDFTISREGIALADPATMTISNSANGK